MNALDNSLYAEHRAAYHAAMIREAIEAIAEYRGDAEYREGAEYREAPGRLLPLLEGLELYLTARIETGGFLRAVLENDFSGAVGSAHRSLTLDTLKGLNALIYTHFPAKSHGSPAAVQAWLDGDGEAADCGAAT